MSDCELDEPNAALDEDVAAILGLTPAELKRGVAAWAWLGTRSTWALVAGAVVVPAIVVALVVPLSRPRPQPEVLPLPRPPLVMQAASPPPIVEAAVEPDPVAPRRESRPIRVAKADTPRPAAPAPPPETEAAAAPEVTAAPPITRQARNDLLDEDEARGRTVAARLDAVDALRALRQR